MPPQLLYQPVDVTCEVLKSQVRCQSKAKMAGYILESLHQEKNASNTEYMKAWEQLPTSMKWSNSNLWEYTEDNFGVGYELT